LMTTAERDLVRLRLRNQRLAGTGFRSPVDVVAWLGAAQAQDYPAARWGLGLRADEVSDADVERAFNAGAILRTHVLRPTWHFVTPADIRWILGLTAPRVHAVNAYCYRRFELDARTLTRGRAAFERALRGGRQLTRSELAVALERTGIRADKVRLAYLVMHAELEQVLCSGARRGKQFTYALLEERAPRARPLNRDEALAELTRRYFSSHGPATLRDFVWWSGLTTREARAGLGALGSALTEMVVGGRTCWLASRGPDVQVGRGPDLQIGRGPALPIGRRRDLQVGRRPSSVHLLPNYDEYLIAYKDRGAVVHQAGKDAFSHYILIDGRLAGTWTRIEQANSVQITAAPYRRLTGSEMRALSAAADRYGTFVNKAVSLSLP
jgi:hypothetical protein